jgi:hypothetical protein
MIPGIPFLILCFITFTVGILYMKLKYPTQRYPLDNFITITLILFCAFMLGMIIDVFTGFFTNNFFNYMF